MRHDLASLITALRNAPSHAVKAQLTRLVPFHHLVSNIPPDWLYTSGKPQRYNPAGVKCIYFGESLNVARAEYESALMGFAQSQPVTVFHARIDLKRVLDLTHAKTLNALELNSKDLFQNWRLAKIPIAIQLLGQAVNDSKTFSAIKYPSKVMADRGQEGANYVIFRNCVHAPDSIEILGPTSKPLQNWP